jgi:hypothetical protein
MRHASILPYTARRLRSLVVPLLLVALAARAEAIGPTVITSVDDLIDAPRALFGRTRAQVEGALGAPLAVRQRALPGLLHPEVVLPEPPRLPDRAELLDRMTHARDQ